MKWEEICKERDHLKHMETQVKTLQVEKGKMYALAQHFLGFHRSSPTYPLFLQEKYFLFLLAAVKEVRPCRMDTPSTFLEYLYKSNIHDQHLLCELYLHEVACFGDKTFSISP